MKRIQINCIIKKVIEDKIRELIKEAKLLKNNKKCNRWEVIKKKEKKYKEIYANCYYIVDKLFSKNKNKENKIEDLYISEAKDLNK